MVCSTGEPVYTLYKTEVSCAFLSLICTVWCQVLLVCSTGEPVLGIWAVDCSPSSFGFADCTLSSLGFVEGHTNVL